MRILYLDCFSGISGDMTVGALRDLGVPESVFQEAVAALGLGDEIHLHFTRDQRQGISGSRFQVHTHDHPTHTHEHPTHTHEHPAHTHDHPAHTHDHPTHPHDHPTHPHEHALHIHGRTWREIRALLENANLVKEVRDRAISTFQRIAIAEAKIHGVPMEDIGFHEVGAADSIADIVAACAGFHALGPLRVESSTLCEGSGWVDCAHGKFPLPAPATLEILAGIPLRQINEPVEFITPTGAALLAEFATRFGTMPETRVEKVGYGIGTRDTHPRPNVLRAILGEIEESSNDETDEISQIETNLDDLSPEMAGDAMNRFFAAGALDVFFAPVQMKKNRPAFQLTVLCDINKTQEMARLILRETTSFGVRIHRVQRLKLHREFRDTDTPYGAVRVKLGFLGGKLIQASPEFESCRSISESAGVPLRDVYVAASIRLKTSQT